ncbi:MAG: hypothetical protein ACREEP_21325 [Dongiaceae bacterium]
MKSARIAALLFGLGVPSATLIQPALSLDEARLHKFFDLMDSDGNGRVSRPEFQSGKGAVFLAIDEDGSMTLAQNEMRLSPEGFKLLAGDDGIVDGPEFIAADTASFEAIDRNKDHDIEFAELRDYVAKYAS